MNMNLTAGCYRFHADVAIAVQISISTHMLMVMIVMFHLDSPIIALDWREPNSLIRPAYMRIAIGSTNRYAFITVRITINTA